MKHTSRAAQDRKPPKKLGIAMNRFLMVCSSTAYITCRAFLMRPELAVHRLLIAGTSV